MAFILIIIIIIHYYKNLFPLKCNCYAYDAYDSNATITFSFSASMPVERKHGLWITDYGLMSCDTPGDHNYDYCLGGYKRGIRNGKIN